MIAVALDSVSSFPSASSRVMGDESGWKTEWTGAAPSVSLSQLARLLAIVRLKTSAAGGQLPAARGLKFGSNESGPGHVEGIVLTTVARIVGPHDGKAGFLESIGVRF